MIYRCICGNQKNGQPYHTASVKKWVCSPACRDRWHKFERRNKPKARKLFASVPVQITKVFMVLLLCMSVVHAKSKTIKDLKQPLAIPLATEPKKVKVVDVLMPLAAVPVVAVERLSLAPVVMPVKIPQVLTSVGVGLTLAVTITGGLFLYKRRVKNYGFYIPSRYAKLFASSHYRRTRQELADSVGSRSEQPSVLPQFLEPSGRRVEQRRYGDHSPTLRPRLTDDAIIHEWGRSLPTE